ncbi:MAG: zinc-binding dehydrogenase, partial [Candidatus Thorarchaeota archaeon]|nr:zinc-binding dehydrogenase [Candidatus Thorarchaeota archaeon]
FKAGSICGTDLHFYRGEWTKMRIGQVIGHDACGIRVDTGERVAMVPIIYCGSCYFCLRGLPHLCENGKFMGMEKVGFFTEFIAIPIENLVPIPKNVSTEEAAMLEPVALAIDTLDFLRTRLRDWVTIVGQGPIGLLTTQIAKLKGCLVIAIDLHDYRLKLSEKYGADVCINAREEDPMKKVKEVTRRGSDVVIEAAGTKQTVEQTPFLVRSAGKVALLGESEGYLDLGNVGEAMFSTVYITPIHYPLALNLISEKIVDVKSLITHRFKLLDFEHAIQTAGNFAERPVKVVITK